MTALWIAGHAHPGIERIDLHRAGGPIPRQGNARTSWDRRDSIVVALHDRAGRVGLGEAAPLPGLSRDTLEEAEAALRAWTFSAEVEPTASGWSRFARDLRRDLASPAARYALELAMLDLVGQATQTPASQLIRSASPAESAAESVSVSALLGDLGAPGAFERARALVRQGARTLKVKLGARPVVQDVSALQALRAELGPGIALIGDVNGAWTVDVARLALELLAPCGLDYVEQPVPADAIEDLGPGPLPIWADESLVLEQGRWAAVGAPDVSGVVCKPTLLGGLLASLDVALRANRLGKGVVVTHALEGPIAMAGCAALALSLGEIAPRAGVWPHDALGAFPDVALPGFCGTPAPGYAGGTLRATDVPGLGITDEERRWLVALPRIGDLR